MDSQEAFGLERTERLVLAVVSVVKCDLLSEQIAAVAMADELGDVERFPNPRLN